MTYVISYSVGKHSQQIIDGIPIQDVVKTGFYSYFKYIYSPGSEDILIKLTTLAGDPEIIVSTKQKIKFPTKETADVISTSD